ncbi:hypothetical protein [Paucibacter soli]|uniref:hypothetical protein n=1 Tax=Paucibacter soli TaxID=3133433 RepID=UPI00309ACF4E
MPRVCCACLLALCCLAAQARPPTLQDEQLVETGWLTSNRALLMVPDRPRALALLFPGGGGDLGLSGGRGMVNFGSQLYMNFLVAARGLFFERDLAVLIIDAPGGRAMSAQQRLGALGQLPGLLAQARKLAPLLQDLPVWALGTSAGTISVAGLIEQAPDYLAGVVLSSSITQGAGEGGQWNSANPQGIASMRLDRFERPVLVLAHRDDQCRYTPPADAALLDARFVRSVRHRALVLETPSRTFGDPCGPNSPHGFAELESEAVESMVRFMLD